MTNNEVTAPLTQLLAGRIPIDYRSIRSLDQFRSVAAACDLIVAVDTVKHGNWAIVYGTSALHVIAATTTTSLRVVAFAIDFRGNQVEHLLAAVGVVKGHYEWNHEITTMARPGSAAPS